MLRSCRRSGFIASALVTLAVCQPAYPLPAQGGSSFTEPLGGYLLAPGTQEVHRLDLATGRLIEKLKLPVADTYHNVARTQDNRLIIAGNEAVSIVDARSGNVERTFPLPAAVVTARLDGSSKEIPVLQSTATRTRRLFGLGYEPRTERAYLGVVDDEGEITLYRLDLQKQTLQVLATVNDIPNPRDLVVTADGLRIYISSVQVLPEPAARVYPVNPLTGERAQALDVSFDPRRPSLTLSTDGNLLYLTAADESLIVVNTRSNSPVRRLRIRTATSRSKIVRVVPALDNRHLWIALSQPDRLVLWDPFDDRAALSEELPALAIDVAMSADKSRLVYVQKTSAVAGKPAEVRVWDTTKEDELPVVAHFAQPSGVNRVVLADAPLPSSSQERLPKVAVVGFETGPVRYGRFPKVADVIGADLLRTRRYEILPPLQVQSVLETLGLEDGLQADPDAIRQVASLLGADAVLVGKPLRFELPNRALESLAGLINPLAALLVPQFSSPKVFSSAEAFDQEGKSIWKADMVNFESAFMQGKTDLVLLSNAMIITGHDVANRFSKGAYNDVKTGAGELPPISRDEALKTVRRIAMLGPDSALFNEQTNSPESLGQLVAERLSAELGWEVTAPNEAFGHLAQLGIERPQVLTTDPQLLARTLGVDAVMLGLVRSSTYYSGGFIGFGNQAADEVIIQFELIDQQGRVLWKDIQVRNIPVQQESAVRQAAAVVVERLQQGIRPTQANQKQAPAV